MADPNIAKPVSNVFSLQNGFDFSNAPLPNNILTTKEFADVISSQTSHDVVKASALFDADVDKLENPVEYLNGIISNGPPDSIPNIGGLDASLLTPTRSKRKEGQHKCTCQNSSCLKRYDIF